MVFKDTVYLVFTPLSLFGFEGTNYLQPEIR
jgi:hypothetical protein